MPFLKSIFISLMCLICLFGLLSLGWLQKSAAPDGWKAFAKVNFKEEYHEEYDAYFYLPEFGEEIKDLEGSIVSLRGHCMPFETEGNLVVLSKGPYSSCFFCGAAGPETVAEVYFKHKTPRFKPDQVIVVEGRLKLNATEIDRFNFILEDAVWLKK